MNVCFKGLLRLACLFAFLLFPARGYCAETGKAVISGRIVSPDKEGIGFASVSIKDSSTGVYPDEHGVFSLAADAGTYTIVFSALGFETEERRVSVAPGDKVHMDVCLKERDVRLGEVQVTADRVGHVKRSAYNAVVVDTKGLSNSSLNLSDALEKVPGMKIRETGGVGSDMQVMLDGFSGKHVKVFIDGVPQEGVGSSFGLNNIPVNFAERIEVYRGVVPVGFGTDALGGVVNIVTRRNRRSWFADASYSYGSFNTHKSYVNFGQTLKRGFSYEVNVFQNFSDNSYHVDADHVKQWNDDGSTVITDETFRVKRFNDRYHNEAVMAKLGVVGKNWADRLMFGFTFSNMYKAIQTGVRQYTVFGEKHRRGRSFMPSLEYSKRSLFVKGLDVVLTANYNRNIATNVDTSRYIYNWFGQRKPNPNGRGEQSEQFSRAYNDNWNATVTVNYRFGRIHMLSFNNVWNAFRRTNTSLLTGAEIENVFDKVTRKNVAGISYRLMPSEKWNISVFGKYYHQFVSGPMATDANASDFSMVSRTLNSAGYGAAGTYFVLPGLQAKVSYEKAYRLPTIEEMFGDEDLESGKVDIRPENSDNVNVNINYSGKFGRHSLFAEGGMVFRYTRDYIQRNIQDLSGGRENATYVNYGKVRTVGFNVSARYGFSKWLSIGGSFTRMEVRDMNKYQIGSTGIATYNLTYKARMANVPYMFADGDVSFHWHHLGRKDAVLTVSYDNRYLHGFCYNSEVIGSNNDDYMIPDQFSHNLSIGYSLCGGRYNFSFECRNLTDERLYDNFSLQKAGRAFYGKVRVCLSGRGEQHRGKKHF